MAAVCKTAPPSGRTMTEHSAIDDTLALTGVAQ
jgi:hypothetical protein